MCCDKDKCRVLTLFTNAVCLIIGIAVIVSSVSSMQNEKDKTVFFVFCSVGGAVCTLSIIGCCGVLKQKAWINWIYVIIMLSMVLMTTYMLLYHFKSEEDNGDALRRLIEAFNKTNKSHDKTELSDWQRKFHCCGINSYVDYNDNDKLMPASCKNGTIEYFKKGCKTQVLEYLQKPASNIKTFGYIFLGIEAVSLLSAFILAIQLSYTPQTKPKPQLRPLQARMPYRY